MFAFLRSRPSAVSPVVDAPLLDALAAAHDAALAEADATFTPERAAAQRDAILARLGATADPRVLSFPPRALDAIEPEHRSAALLATSVTARTATPRPALGWMLTAAAAGLVVGVGTGQGLYLEWQPEQVGIHATAGPSRSTSPVVATTTAATEADDAILRDVEKALSERGVDELQPLDAITPRVTLVASR